MKGKRGDRKKEGTEETAGQVGRGPRWRRELSEFKLNNK